MTSSTPSSSSASASNTRSSRSSKKTTSEIPKIKLNIKKKKRTRKDAASADLENKIQLGLQQQKQEQSETGSKESFTVDVSEHPEYVRLMEQLDKSKAERLKRVENWRNYEHQSIKDWFAAQKKQAWDDFYFARQKVRSDLVKEVQQKMVKLKQELAQLNKQSKLQECDFEDWVPPERLHAIGSFVGGASNDEIDRDITYARQPYNGANTPNLVYSDYESRSTTDTAEEVEEEEHEGEVISPVAAAAAAAVTNTTTITTTMSSNSTTNRDNNVIHHNDLLQQQQQQQHFQHHQHHHHPIQHHNILPPPTPSASSSAFHNSMYPQPPHPPPYGFEEISAERWWPFRSTTTA